MLSTEQIAWNQRIYAGTASRNDPHGVYDMFGNPKEHVDMEAVEQALKEIKDGKRSHYLHGNDYAAEFENYKRRK